MRKRFLFLAVLLVGQFTPASSEAVAREVPSRNDQNADWEQRRFASFPFVQDALRRWSKKHGGSVESAKRHRTIQIMEFPTKICVQFELEVGSVGGTPVYCYKRAAPTQRRAQISPNDLIEEYSNVD